MNKKAVNNTPGKHWVKVRGGGRVTVKVKVMLAVRVGDDTERK